MINILGFLESTVYFEEVRRSMNIEQQPTVIFHMGMHKTGSTSYQHSLDQARGSLKARGVLYPDSIDGSFFPQQHADIVHLLFNGKKDDIEQYFNEVKLEALNNNYKKIIFSSEDFSSLGDVPVCLENFYKMVREIFPKSTYIMVIRNAVDHLHSSICEMIEGNNLVANNMLFHSQCEQILINRSFSIANIQRILKSKLLFLEYSSLLSDDLLCSNLHRYVDPETVDLISESKHNVSIEKDFLYLLTSSLRGVVSVSIDKPVYSAEVEHEIKKFVDLDHLSSALLPDAVMDFKKMYSTALRQKASEVVAQSRPHLLEILSELDPTVLNFYLPPV